MIRPYSKNKISLKVRQIDFENGETINIFLNRYQAAKWIIDNGLTSYFYKSESKTRCCIAGTLTNSIIRNQQIYGYKWELFDGTEECTILKSQRKIISKNIVTKEQKEFSNITLCANFYKTDFKTIKKYLNNKQLYKTIIEFREIKE